jgi:hypothetical protein
VYVNANFYILRRKIKMTTYGAIQALREAGKKAGVVFFLLTLIAIPPNKCLKAANNPKRECC